MKRAAAVSRRLFFLKGLPALALAILTFQGTLSGQAESPSDEPPRRLRAIDVARIRELHHITDLYGDAIWPGFDTRKTPIAVNNDDREELLINHPAPPEGFHPFEDFEIDGRPVLIMDGVTRYGPKGGGWAVEIKGKQSAYVSTLKAGWDTEGYLSLILHECFHCFQKNYRRRADGAHGEHPEVDPVYSALLGLESWILKAALEEKDEKKVRELAGMFAAARRERRRGLPDHLVLLEGEEEYNEGTATYSQVRMLELLAEKGGIEPLGAAGPSEENGGIDRLGVVEDPQYNGFKNAGELLERMLSGILPPTDRPVTFFHSMYNHGMAQCLVLDRLRPGWKEEMREKGSTQFALLERELALEAGEEEELLAAAKKRFDYGGLFEEQKKRIDEQLDVIRGFVLAPGRRYRIHHAEITKGFKWKPFGPVYHVPEVLERELREKLGKAGGDKTAPEERRRIVWAGGIRRFEKEGLLFESREVPVIYGFLYLEWIDPDPAEDDGDMLIEAERLGGGTYHDVKIETDGFTLEAAVARIEWSRELVEIHLK